MKQEKLIHEFYGILKNIVWHSFHEVGLDNPWFRWTYAEDRLYIVQDVMLENYWFVEAASPVKALEWCQNRMEDASYAGEWVDEGVE